MSERPTKDEREALIAGDRAGALEPNEAAELDLLADLLSDPSTWAEPDPGLEGAIVRAVAIASAEPRPPSALPPTATTSSQHARSRWPRVGLSIVAAAAAIAIVLGVVAATRGGTRNDFKSQLTATALAPGASGSAGISRNGAGFRVVLDARGLSALPAGEYYQAWLKNPAGTLVPIGTFSSSDGRVTLWSGVSPVEFHTITVTIQATDNVQTSSGRRVLLGEVHKA